MNDAIDLTRKRDRDFTAAVEAQSGQNVSTCYQCGNCSAGCPAGFVYDLQANQIMRGVQLGLKDQVLNSRSIWMCLSCSTCSLRCPNNIDVAEVMETLRHMARKEGRVAVPKVEKFWFSFLDTVRKFGRTYEIGTMVLYMLRSLHGRGPGSPGPGQTEAGLQAPFHSQRRRRGCGPHHDPLQGTRQA